MPMPPGPDGPTLYHTLRVLREPIGYLERCLERYGDLFTIRFVGMGKLVYVVDPAVVKQIFIGDPAVYRAGDANQFMEPLIGKRSILLLDEQEHLRERRLLLPPFHGERVRRYGELMAEIAEREVASWPLDRPFPVRPRMQAVTLEAILRAVFGIRDAERLARLLSLIPRMLERGNLIVWMPWLRRDLGPLTPWRRFAQARAEVDSILYDEIRRRRAGPAAGDGEDILSLLIEARDEQGSLLSEGELRDELMTLLAAGHETTATGLAWAFERIVRHPAVLERLQAELASNGEAYLDAVVKETLRSRPPVFDVARKLAAPVQMKQYTIDAGAYVVPAITLVQRLPRIYPDPDAFRPERFLEGHDESYTWIPFGGGSRRCVGAAFATQEMKVVLRKVLELVRLRSVDDRGERIKLRHVTLVPDKEAVVTVAERLAGGTTGRRSRAASSTVAV